MFLKSRRLVLLGGLAAIAAGVASKFGGGSAANVVKKQAVAAKARLGINLAGISDASTEQPFVDFFKQSREWISQTKGASWGQGADLDLDQHGWVKALPKNGFATRIIASAENGQYPSGQYIVLYDGEGKLGVNESMGKVVSSEPGRLVVAVDATKNLFWLDLLETNSDNYIRNIRVLRPEFEKTYQDNPWHPDFLKRWAGVACLRMMDWMSTNHSPIKHWDDRPKLQDASYTTKGVPMELLVDLANRLETDLWCCMPHLADDAYVDNAAQYIKANLKHQVWVEYSNETWNTIFKQSMHAITQGRKAGFYGSTMEIGAQYTAKRSVEIFEIWKRVFADQSERVVNVLSGFAAMPVLTEKMLEVDKAAQLTDVFAIAPYIPFNVPEREQNGVSASIIAKWSLDRLFEHVEHFALPEANKAIDAHLGIAKDYGIRLVAYESGQHLVGIQGGENNKKLTDLFVKANADSRMGEIYTKNLNYWQQAGGDLICSFNSMGQWTKWGSWGLLRNRNEDKTKSPKFSAVVAWAKTQGQTIGQ